MSSILKAPGVRSQLLRQSNRVYFKLPTNLKSIIYNFEAGTGIKDYEDLICILKDSNIKDTDLIEFLAKVRQCISLLGPVHKALIEALLQIKWTNRSQELATAYKAFLEDLICMQVYYAKYVIDNLIEHFKPDVSDNTEWESGNCNEEDTLRLDHIHDVLHKILKVVPMSSKLLLQSLRGRFPYIVHGTHTHEVYVSALLQILDYAPQLRSDILSLIINRLMVLDVNIPRVETSKDDDEDSMDGSECDGMLETENPTTESESASKENAIHPIAHKLDVCMELLLKYVHDYCFHNGVLHIDNLKVLYFDILQTFETVILPTHASQYVQYIVFYICSFKSAVVEAFVEWLWRKASDPSIPSITRQSSVAYIASLLATAKFITPGLLKGIQSRMAKWIHDYIAMQCRDSSVSTETKEHLVFYSICQALFYLIIKKHNDYTDSKNYMLFLQELDLPKIISCKLNPLKACQSDIVHSFAEVTRTYQLAYCYTIIENNMRTQLPIYSNRITATPTVENFFPFSMYPLPRSGERLVTLLRDNSMNPEQRSSTKDTEETVEYMTD